MVGSVFLYYMLGLYNMASISFAPHFLAREINHKIQETRKKYIISALSDIYFIYFNANTICNEAKYKQIIVALVNLMTGIFIGICNFIVK